MDALTIAVNEDGTLTFTGPIADPVLCPVGLWAELAVNDHVVIDARPPLDEWTPGVTYITMTCPDVMLQYRVRSQNGDGYQLELAGYTEF